MPENNFDLVPPEEIIDSTWEREQKEAFGLRLRTVRQLGYKFPIYRGLRKDLVGQDLNPASVLGKKGLNVPPMSPEEALKSLVEHGASLIRIAWSHARYPGPMDPTISWTTDIEVARERARVWAEASGKGGMIIQAEGTPMPASLPTFRDLQPNFVIYIPILAEIRGDWPSEASKQEAEAVTFGTFPQKLYRVIEEV